MFAIVLLRATEKIKMKTNTISLNMFNILGNIRGT